MHEPVELTDDIYWIGVDDRETGSIFKAYDRWSRHETEPGAVLVYGSMYANTQKMAEAVARGLALSGVKQVKVHNAAFTHISYLLTDIWRYKCLALGSCTYDVQLFPPVRQLVSMLQSKQMKNRCLGIFGSYGWSGGAVKELRQFAESPGWELVEPVVEARCAPGGDDLARCLELGRNLGAKMAAPSPIPDEGDEPAGV